MTAVGTGGEPKPGRDGHAGDEASGAGSAGAGSAGRVAAVDIGLRVGGTVAGLLLGLLAALWEIFLSPLYAGRVPLPVSPVLAVLTSLGLVWFTRAVTGRNGLALLPGVAWFGTMVLAANRTHEGDLLLPGNDYMGLVAILFGSVAWGLAGYRMVLAGRPMGPLVAQPTPAGPSADTTVPSDLRPSASKPRARQAPAPKPGVKPVSAGRVRSRRHPPAR